jgi:hypothetical protein
MRMLGTHKKAGYQMSGRGRVGSQIGTHTLPDESGMQKRSGESRRVSC